jgi:Kef-type K+ transport system membrane component KefB
MILLQVQEFSLPLTNPTLKFFIILVIILFAPLLFNKLRIPNILGLIIAGAIIGPHGFNLIHRDSGIILSGTAGLLYIMFLAGIEIDLADFRKNRSKSLLLGLYGFFIPMLLGTALGFFLLKFSLETSILLASMFASHTLITYPIIQKTGIVKNRAVNITVGSTLITNILALLVLAVIVGHTSGNAGNLFWIRLGASILLFGALVWFLFPLIGRWFFKRYEDNVSQYIFVLAMVFLGAVLAETAGIEGIIGAFLAGLALNRLIPQTSPLMNRIDFVGNAIFIPFFLIGVGMLIDFSVFLNDVNTLKVALAMTITATAGKYLAAWLTQKNLGFNLDERRVIFGLSNAQAAATLAAVLIGYNIILGETPDGEPVRLLNDSVLNGTIIMILVTCTIASFMTQKGARNIALAEAAEIGEEDQGPEERILIPISNPDTTVELVNLSVMIKSKKNRTGLYALNIINNTNPEAGADRIADKILDTAVKTASATDNYLNRLLRYDLNIVNGITSVIKEHRITDLVLGLHVKKGISESFLGNLTEGILTKCNTTTLVYKASQPLATINRHLVIVPEHASKEIGFPFWLLKVWNIARNSGAKIVFYGSGKELRYIRDIHARHPIDASFIEFNDWNDFLILSRDVKEDDGLIIALSRKNKPSYHDTMAAIPHYLNKYFQKCSFILIYPIQLGVSDITEIDLNNPSLLEPIERLDDIGKTIASIFKRK